MEVVLKRFAWTDGSEAARNLQNWLICWLLLPNLGFWLLYVVGGPPRWAEILMIGVIGIATHRAPFAVRYAAFVVAMIYSTLTFVSSMFNVGLASLLYSLELAKELNFSASVEYLVCGIAVLATFAAGAFFLRRPVLLARPSLIVAAMGITCTAGLADYWMSRDSLGSYNRIAAAGAPFTSASGASGFEKIATGERHAVIIMVEAMGVPQDPALRRRLVDIWARPEVRARYEVTTGDTLFYGSTTSGEIRELCGRWGDYFEVLKAKSNCLPARLAKKGYHSQGWHSFRGFFFQRTRWYPNIGFQEMRFGDRLLKDGAGECPGVFPGACDRDVPAQIAATLKSARQPQFLYWLTVNTHLPVIKDRDLQTENCERFDPTLNSQFPMTCRTLSLFDQTARALAAEISARDFPASDILIVGDHIPPFFDRHHRQEFAPDRVPWILLRRKAR